MILLSASEVTKHYGPQPVLDGVTFEVRPGEKVGLVGPNGAGKTTLMKILTGEEQADGGNVELHLLPGAPKELGNELREKLNAWTGMRWIVALSNAPGERPLGVVQREREAAELSEIRSHPAVAAVLQQFPDAKVKLKPLPGSKG